MTADAGSVKTQPQWQSRHTGNPPPKAKQAVLFNPVALTDAVSGKDKQDQGRHADGTIANTA